MAFVRRAGNHSDKRGVGAACWNVKLLVYDGKWERNRGNKSSCSKQQLTAKVVVEIAIELAEQLVGIVGG